MSGALKLMDADEFFDWAEAREEVWELVDGVPVMKRPELMSFTTQRHNLVVGNIVFALRSRLGRRCRVWTESIGVRTSATKVRRPDIMVDCSPMDPLSRETKGAAVMFEVLSPSTRRIDLHQKPFEYRQLPSLQHLVLVEPGVAACTLYSRQADGRWGDHPVIGLEAVIELTAIDVGLPLSEVYEGVDLDETS